MDLVKVYNWDEEEDLVWLNILTNKETEKTQDIVVRSEIYDSYLRNREEIDRDIKAWIVQVENIELY